MLIAGQEMVHRTLVRGFQLSEDISQRIAEATMLIIGDPTDLEPYIKPGAEVSVLTGQEISGGPLFGETLFGEQVFGGTAVGTPLFSGTISKVTPRLLRVATPGGVTTVTEYTLSCRDWGALLDSAVVTTVKGYTDQDDQSIIKELFTTYLSSIDTTDVNLVAVLPTLTVQQTSLRSAMEQICDLSGGEFSMRRGTKKIKYYSPAGEPAPFSLSDSPNNSTTFAPYRNNLQYAEEFSSGANRVTVLGKGSITQTVNDATSQSEFGILSTVVVDRNIQSDLEAQARGNVELARRAQPQKTGSFQIRRDGLSVGQLLSVVMPTLGISGSFLIRKVVMTWTAPWNTVYQVEFGDYKPDLVKMLRALQKAAGEKPYLIEAEVGEITIDNFAASIEPIQIVNSLPTLPDTNYSMDAVVLLTQDRKLYRRNGMVWTAVVPAADLSGQITETQITDSAITTPKISALAITAQKLAAEAVTIGKIAADAITAGTIGAGAIRAQDVAFENGAIQTADIGDLQVTNAKIANATISGGKIQSVTITASNIQDGTITGAKIGNSEITGAKIQGGTITGAHLVDATITGGKIQDATISNAKITSLSADKITAGSITASISISAATITGSTLTLNKNGIVTTIDALYDYAGYVGVKVSDASYKTIIGTNEITILSAGGNPYVDLSVVSSGGRLGLLYSSAETISLTANNGAIYATTLEAGSTNGRFGSSYVSIGRSGSTGYARFNGLHYALWTDVNGKKVVAGSAQFSSGHKSIFSGLTSVDAAVGVHYPGGSGHPSEYVGVGSYSGGTVEFTSSNTSSNGWFHYMIFGNA